MIDTNKHPVLSLFSCGGGLDLGFEGGFTAYSNQIDAEKHPDWIDSTQVLDDGRITLSENDFECVFACDIDRNAKNAWVRFFQEKNHKNEAQYELESVVSLVKKAKAGEYEFPSADIVLGGFPCCDFSVSGKRQGFNSTKSDTEGNIDAPTPENRGMLYYWMREVIELVNPKMFVAENVKGMVSLEDVKETIEEDFRNIGGGFIVIPARVLHSADFGVAQNRERIIFFGFNKDFLTPQAIEELSKEDISPLYDPYPAPTHNYTDRNNDSLLPFVSVSDVLGDLCEPEFSNDESHKVYSKAKYLGTKCQGQKEVNLSGVGPTIRSKHHGNIEYRRLSAEHGGTHADELSSGLPERRLSVRECARIQSFPDEYDFVFSAKKGEKGSGVSGSAAYVLVGNAVPPVMAYNIARSIQDKWHLYFGK